MVNPLAFNFHHQHNDDYVKCCIYAFNGSFERLIMYLNDDIYLDNRNYLTYCIIRGILFYPSFAVNLYNSKIRLNMEILRAICCRFIMSDCIIPSLIKLCKPFCIWFPQLPSKSTCLRLLEYGMNYPVACVAILLNWKDVYFQAEVKSEPVLYYMANVYNIQEIVDDQVRKFKAQPAFIDVFMNYIYNDNEGCDFSLPTARNMFFFLNNFYQFLFPHLLTSQNTDLVLDLPYVFYGKPILSIEKDAPRYFNGLGIFNHDNFALAYLRLLQKNSPNLASGTLSDINQMNCCGGKITNCEDSSTVTSVPEVNTKQYYAYVGDAYNYYLQASSDETDVDKYSQHGALVSPEFAMLVLNNRTNFSLKTCRNAVSQLIIENIIDEDLIEQYQPFHIFKYKFPKIETLQKLEKLYPQYKCQINMAYIMLDGTMNYKDLQPEINLLKTAKYVGNKTVYEDQLDKANQLGIIYQYIDYDREITYEQPQIIKLEEIDLTLEMSGCNLSFLVECNDKFPIIESSITGEFNSNRLVPNLWGS